MAVQLSVEIHGSQKAQKLDPRDLLSNFPAFTGRFERSPEDIRAMADSLLLHGQLQPILFRKGFDGAPIPVAGCTRILAACMITEMGMKSPTGVKFGPDAPYYVYGVYKQCNEREALFATVTENDVRNPLTAVDYALFIRTASESFGMSDAEIASGLGKDPSWVSKHRVILELDDATRREVATGAIALDPAVNVGHHIAPEQREVVISKAKERNGGKATTKALTEAAAEVGAKINRKQKPTLANIKEWAVLGMESFTPGPMQKSCVALHSYLAGDAPQRGLTDALVIATGGR